MNKTYCDICGKEGKKQMVTLHAWEKGRNFPDWQSLDLCKECHDKIRLIIWSKGK